MMIWRSVEKRDFSAFCDMARGMSTLRGDYGFEDVLKGGVKVTTIPHGHPDGHVVLLLSRISPSLNYSPSDWTIHILSNC